MQERVKSTPEEEVVQEAILKLAEIRKNGLNAYQILGLDDQATKAEILRAFRIISQKYHPDKVNILLIRGDERSHEKNRREYDIKQR